MNNTTIKELDDDLARLYTLLEMKKKESDKVLLEVENICKEILYKTDLRKSKNDV